jgi:hypothetical protein
MILGPETDGIDHLNVYSKAMTISGRWASNFARTPIDHPRHGHFVSIEGLWYWLSTRDDRLREVSGFAAKQLGRDLRAPDWVSTQEFKNDIVLGIRAKITVATVTRNIAWIAMSTRPWLDLPLAHYYVYGAKIIDETARCQWMLDVFEQERIRAL